MASRLISDKSILNEEKYRPTKYGMDAVSTVSKIDEDDVLGEDALVNKKKKISLDSVLKKGSEMSITIVKINGNESNLGSLAKLMEKTLGDL